MHVYRINDVSTISFYVDFPWNLSIENTSQVDSGLFILWYLYFNKVHKLVRYILFKKYVCNDLKFDVAVLISKTFCWSKWRSMEESYIPTTSFRMELGLPRILQSSKTVFFFYSRCVAETRQPHQHHEAVIVFSLKDTNSLLCEITP